eukprot:Hpha_TRINITY_DN3729_c0_g1::TRINITY_DN3729_c0_g1_i1::g.23805::m.23805
MGFLVGVIVLAALATSDRPGKSRKRTPAPVPVPGSTQKVADYAWTTIFYEAGHNDDEYFIGARVLMESIRQSGTEADRVVLVGPGTKPKYMQGFRKDGCSVRHIENVPSPWGSKTPKRFLFALNKLAVWTLTEYKRVIYLDADVIVLQPADFLFQCGHFCAVFMNPINFHTAILIIKPSEDTYRDMLAKLKTLGSFDGADQGFFNEYYRGLNAASEWTKSRGKSEDAMNRLPIQYNMNHIYYYEKMRWGGVWGSPEEIITMTFPVTPIGKPWYWYLYPHFTMHLWWLRYRTSIESVTEYPMQLGLFVLAPLLAHALTQLERKVAARKGSTEPTEKSFGGASAISDSQMTAAGLWCVWGRMHCIGVTTGFALHFFAAVVCLRLVPGITPPILAWPLFVSYHLLILSHSAQWLWIKLHGCRLRLERRVYLLYIASWVVYFVTGSLPIYPHGLIAGAFALVISPLTSFGLLTAMFKIVCDSNQRAGSSGPPHSI